MNKLLKVTAASLLLTAPALFGEIKINENLSVTGFLDMSFYDDEDGNSYDIDQFEIDFLISQGEVSAEIDLEYTDDLTVESAWLTYDLGNGSSFRAGRFLSYLGWETIEPTGLFQYSNSYVARGNYYGAIPGYQDGIAYDVTNDVGTFGISIVDSVLNMDGGLNSEDLYEFGVEAKAVFTPADGWTVFLGYGLDIAGEAIDNTGILNLWTSYATGIHTFAGEYNQTSSDWDDFDQMLLMWSAAVSDTGTFTARFSENWSDHAENDFRKYTAAYMHAITDNLLLVTEFSTIDSDNSAIDGNEIAFEALFTF